VQETRIARVFERRKPAARNRPALDAQRLEPGLAEISLQLATLDGAIDLGIADRTGSITPGKRADLVLLRATDLNMAPVTDPYEAVVSFAMPANVDTVLVDGRILRRAGKFTAFDDRQIATEAREAANALRDKAKWPT
jgi:cytosine/adenosine deaminase-related metal-dependent hydrolase